MWAFFTVDPYFLVLFTAIELYLIQFVATFYGALAQGEQACLQTFGPKNKGFCKVFDNSTRQQSSNCAYLETMAYFFDVLHFDVPVQSDRQVSCV